MSQVGGEGHSLPQTLTEPSTSIQTDLFFFCLKQLLQLRKKKAEKVSALLSCCNLDMSAWWVLAQASKSAT